MAAAVVAIALVAPVAIASAASAQGVPTFTVTTQSDSTTSCTPSACSLRGAVLAANAVAAGGAQIVVPAGTYTLDASGATAGDLDITKPMTITGAGAPPGGGATTIVGFNDRVVDVAASNVTISGVVIQGGTARQGAGVKVAAGAGLTLVDSTVRANTASDQGGGIDNAGTLAVARSTVAGNTATKKGGGIYNAGTATLTNVTLHGNSSSAGGGLLSTGAADLRHATITANTSTNRLGGGLQNQGGTATLRGSIVADNISNGSDAKDCSGSPRLDGLNLIGNTSGCNPTGTAPIVEPPGFAGGLADNGGPTETVALLESSEAVDRLTGCGLAGVDQRGVSRPQGAGCDLGAFELSTASVDLELSAAPTEVGAGAAIVPMTALQDAINEAASMPADTEASALRSIALRSIALRSIDVEDVALRSIALRSIALRSIALRSILVEMTALRSIALRSIALRSILLSEVEILDGRTWEDLLQGTPFEGVPLQNLTLDDVAELADVQALQLEDLDLRSTRLASLSLASILLGSTALRSIPLSDEVLDGREPLEAWCDLLPEGFCEEFARDPGNPELLDVSLLTLDLAGVALRSIALRSIELAGLDLTDTALRSIKLADLAEGTVATVVDCTAFDCENAAATLGDASAHLIGTMADLLLAILGPTDIAWQDVDLAAGGLGSVADPAEEGFTYTAKITMQGAGSAPVSLELDLPPGFAIRQATLGGAALTVADVTVDEDTGRSTATVALGSVAAGQHTVLVDAWAGLDLGPATTNAVATGSIDGVDTASEVASAVVTVGEASEASDESDGIRPIANGELRVSHLSSVGDIDYYELHVPTDGSTATIRLGNLPADYDLVLYGPPMDEPLRGAPTEHLDALADHQLDLDPGDDALSVEPTADIPQTLPPFGGGAVVHRVSARRGTAAERIDTGSLRASSADATYWIQVSGANGASSAQPYSLRAEVTPPPTFSSCPASSFPAMTGAAPGVTVPPGTDTVFLVNAHRLAAAYGATAADDLLAELDAFAARTEFAGAVVHVEDDQAVRDAYAAWDANRCSPDAANDVVRAIGAVIDGVSGLENLVVVGSDAQIPMARVADGTAIANEQSYADAFAGGDELSAALAGGYVLTDNALAATSGVAVNDHEIFLPDISIGRLVETPSDISTMLDSYATADGQLEPSTALVTGYDFLSDGAAAVAAALESLPGPVEILIDELWTSDALAAALADLADDPVASVNAHFDHNRALPAAGNTTGDESDLFDTDEVPASLAGGVLFSMGCHSGLNVSDVRVGAGAPDWAQTFAARGSQWVANTGFGYGDTELVALSEDLMARFAALLAEGEPVGRALSQAKAEYAQNIALVGPYDEKVLHEAVLYGLPMLRVGTAPVEGGLAALAAEGAELKADAPTVAALTAGSAGPTFEFDFSGPEDDATFTHHPTAAGDYYSVGGDTLAQAHRPVQPRTGADLPNGTTANGVLVTELSSVDVGGFNPLFFSPTIDLGGHEPRSVAADATFPSRMAGIATRHGPGGPTQRLVVVPGQFRASSVPGVGTQRLFTRVATEVYPATGAPGPRIGVRSTSATEAAGSITFDVETDHAAERVFILYKGASSNGAWKGLDLAGDGTTWSGVDAHTGPIEYIVQVVGADGRVFWADNKGGDFGNAPVGATPLGITITGGTPVNGWYDGPVTAVVAGADGSTACVLDDQPVACTPSIAVSGDGLHLVEAQNGSGDRVTQLVAIDGLAPTVTAVATPAPGAGGWYQTAPSVTITASDQISGPATITYRIGTGRPVTVSGSTATFVATGSVTYRATDRAGNSTVDATLTINVDSTPPTVAITSPAVGASYAPGATVTATFACTDAQLASCTATVDGVAVSSGGALPSTVGSHDLVVTATDRAGNVATATRTYTVGYRICALYDQAAPTPVGGAVPIKLQLCDASGANLSRSTIVLEAKTINGTIPAPPQDAGRANDGKLFRYDAKLKGYIYNLNTTGLSAGSYTFEFFVVGQPAVTYSVGFVLR